jgi:hypothetical protein
MMNVRDLCFRLEEDTMSMTWTSDRGRPWRHNIAADRFWVVLRLVRRRLQDGQPLVLQELISDTRYPAYQIHLVFRWLQATGLIHRRFKSRYAFTTDEESFCNRAAAAWVGADEVEDVSDETVAELFGDQAECG